MRSKKTYSEYRNDPEVRFSALRWVMDRKTPYVIVALVSALALGLVLKAGWDSYTRSIQDPDVESPYMELISSESKGMLWAKDLVSQNPASLPEWSVSESLKPQAAVDSQICSGMSELPTSLLATRSASGSGVSTRVQVYGAGQAYRQFESYAATLNSCFGELPIERSGNSSFVKYPQGFLITAGDGIVNVSAPEGLYDQTLAFYLSEVETTLSNSECASISSTSEDAKRSFFYNSSEYAGLREKQTLESTVDISALPSPSALEMSDIERMFVAVPEAPLPKDFPELPKATVQKPTLPNAPEDKDAFIADADYQVPDDIGPGCGWEWSAQKSPVYNLSELEEEREYTLRATQDNLNTNAKDYVKNKINWAVQVAGIAPSVDRWNAYANSVNKTHERWEWLNAEREALLPRWNDYIEEYEYWDSFDERKALATKEYEEAVKKCEADEKALEEWKEKWEKKAKEREEAEKKKPTPSPSPSSSSSPTPTPSKSEDVPEKPEGCDTPPVKPEIIDVEKPAEPEAPEIPEGVTIPQSWKNPKSS